MKTIVVQKLEVEELIELIAEKVVSRIKELPEKTETSEKYLTFKETQKRLRLSGPTLHKYCKSGLIPSYRLCGRSLRFKDSDIQALIDQGLRFKPKYREGTK